MLETFREVTGLSLAADVHRVKVALHVVQCAAELEEP